MLVTALASEEVRSIAYAGSSAIALASRPETVGPSFSGAGTGVEMTNQLSTHVAAFVDNSDVTSLAGKIKVSSQSDSQITEAKAYGVAVAANLAPKGIALSVAASVVDNDIRNTVDAYVTGNTGNEIRAAAT